MFVPYKPFSHKVGYQGPLGYGMRNMRVDFQKADGYEAKNVLM